MSYYKSGESFFDKEMEKLEKQQKRLRQEQEDNTRDRHNTIAQQSSIHDYKRIINASLQIAPHTGESLSHYIEKLKIHQEISYIKNWETHVDNGRKTWHTHKMPSCFMCEDQIFISTLIQVLQNINDDKKGIKF